MQAVGLSAKRKRELAAIEGKGKKAYKILQVSEVRYRRLFETAQDGILILDAETGMVEDVNPFLIDMLGYSLAQFKGKAVWELGFFRDAIASRDKFLELQKLGYVRYEDLPLKTAGGKSRHVEFVSNVYLVGEKKVIQCNIRDITERKVAEEALKISEARYRRLFETAKDGILILDAESGIVEDVNPFLADMLGYSMEQFKGKAVWELGFLKDTIANREKFLELQRLEYVRYENLPLETASGQSRHVEFVSNVYLVGGKKVIQCNIRDITERKKAEQELIKAQKLDSIGLLAGGIAHDFNNILTGVIGNISLALQGIGADDKNYEVLADAEKAAQRAKNLTQQLLTFSKGGAPVKRMTAFAPLLQEVATFAARGSKAKCKFNIAPDLMPGDFDPGQIGQVISNFVINSIQAMPQGGDIIISAENAAIPEKDTTSLKVGPYVRITFKDTGTGISESHLKNIFDPYFSTKNIGSGLGLATSYSIIKNHNGYISAESELGKGATFTVYLPAFEGKYDLEKPVERAPEVKNGKGRILILDDEEIVRVLGVRILTRLGYSAETFEQSDKAIARYRQTWGRAEAFDAVILDLTIPGSKSGQDVLAKLKEINPGVQAVVSSGYSADPIMANFKDYGFAAALPKPFSIGEASEVFYGLLMKNHS